MTDPGPSHSPAPSPSRSQLGFIVLPGTPLTPNALAINDDGQFSILTRVEISIFTAKLGLQTAKDLFRQSYSAPEPDHSNADGSVKGKQRERSELDCTRTTIVIERKNIIKWDTFSNEVDIGTPAPTLRIGEALWRDLTWSPTGLAELGGCVLATLTTNHEVIIFEPNKQSNTGEWLESYDVTSHLVKLLILDKEQEAIDEDVKIETFEMRKLRAARVLECQATALAWSPPVDGSLGDFSLLVLGHKSGHVSLWRRWAGGKMEILHRFRMSDDARWITSLEWSRWSLFTGGNKRFAMACLAVSDSNGSVWNLEITQDVTWPRIALRPKDEATEVDNDASGISAAPPVLVGAPDRRPVTQLKWIVTKARRQLVYAKLGVVTVVELHRPSRPSASVYAVKEVVAIDLPTEATGEWMGASSYEPCAGMTYLPKSNAIVVALTSACFYTISLAGRPALVDTSSAQLPTSTELTAHIRQAFMASLEHRTREAAANKREIPRGSITRKTGGRVTGLGLFGTGGEIGWLYEINSPDSLTYRTNPNVKTTFVISSIGSEEDAEAQQLAGLVTLLDKPTNSRLHAPLGLLRSFLHFVQDKAHNAAFVDATLDLLMDLQDITTEVTGPVDPDVRVVATAFYVRLFGEPHLETLRLRETIARFLLRHPKLPRSVANRTFDVHSHLSRQVSKQVITRLGAILHSAQPLLSPQELPISGKVLLASASLELPRQAGEEGVEERIDPDLLAMEFDSEEKCPACSQEIKLANLRKATCVRGHVWDRCSVTLSVIASTKTRTCMGCERKALLELPKPITEERPVTNGDSARPQGVEAPILGEDEKMEVAEEEERAEVVNGMMSAATCCLHCGGRWMKFL